MKLFLKIYVFNGNRWVWSCSIGIHHVMGFVDNNKSILQAVDQETMSATYLQHILSLLLSSGSTSGLTYWRNWVFFLSFTLNGLSSAGFFLQLLHCFCVDYKVIQTGLFLAEILTALQVFGEKEAEQVVFGTLCQIRRLHFFHVLHGKLASLCWFSAFSPAVLVEPLLFWAPQLDMNYDPKIDFLQHKSQ